MDLLRVRGNRVALPVALSFCQEVKELVVLFVQWVAGDEPALYLLGSEE